MADREQVMYDIERCIHNEPGSCMECSHYTGTVGFVCMENLMSDALALLKEQEEEIENLKQTMQSMMEGICLLKEQEPVKPVITPWAENEDGEVVISKRECGRCGYQFFTEKPNYCENCGAPILWEGR